MSEPTLDQIADGFHRRYASASPSHWHDLEDAIEVLARELIALRAFVDRVHSIVGLEISGRLDALEGPAQRQRERDESARTRAARSPAEEPNVNITITASDYFGSVTARNTMSATAPVDALRGKVAEAAASTASRVSDLMDAHIKSVKDLL